MVISPSTVFVWEMDFALRVGFGSFRSGLNARRMLRGTWIPSWSNCLINWCGFPPDEPTGTESWLRRPVVSSFSYSSYCGCNLLLFFFFMIKISQINWLDFNRTRLKWLNTTLDFKSIVKKNLKNQFIKSMSNYLRKKINWRFYLKSNMI